MKLPVDVLELIARDGQGAPATTARALYALDGSLGESYIAANQQRLWLCSRQVGGRLEKHDFPLTAIKRMELRVQAVFAHLEFAASGQEIHLKFSAWDQPALNQLLELWRAAGGASRGATVTAPANPPATLRPWEAFCAAIQAMIRCDDHVDLIELDELARHIPDPALLERGHAWLQENGADTLCRVLPRVLNPAQRRCLFANLVGVIMLDGLLQPAEINLLDRFQTALEIQPTERERIMEVLLQQHRVAVFAEPGGETANDDGLTPLIAFCAALHCWRTELGLANDASRDALERLVGDGRTVNMGINYLAAHGREFLLVRLPSVLNANQRGCLMANLVAWGLADGVLSLTDQTRLQPWQQALGTTPGDHQRLMEVFLLKSDLSVFDAR